MANGLFVPFRNGILGSHATRVDLDADSIKLAMVDNGTVTPNLTTHDFWNDLSTALVGSLSAALGSKTIGTVAAGVFDAADPTTPVFAAVTGNSVESLVALKDTGTASTSDLICLWDTATGLPVTPNGGDINVTFNASGILQV